MRLLAIALAPCLALLACGSSPTESSGTTSQDITSTGPVKGPCQFKSLIPLYEGSGQATDLTAFAWAVETYNGTCPWVAGEGGTWTGTNQDGVTSDGAKMRCKDVFGAGAECCTYSWNPTPYSITPPSVEVAQPLCTIDYASSFFALDDGPPSAPLPGGGNCSPCVGNNLSHGGGPIGP